MKRKIYWSQERKRIVKTGRKREMKKWWKQ